MEIADIAVNNLVPYDKNPRRNDEAAVKVAESIKQFGFKIPLVVGRNNVVVCGHTRLKAAKKLKHKVPWPDERGRKHLCFRRQPGKAHYDGGSCRHFTDPHPEQWRRHYGTL